MKLIKDLIIMRNEEIIIENLFNLDCLKELRLSNRDLKKFSLRKNCQAKRKNQNFLLKGKLKMRKSQRLKGKQVIDTLRNQEKIIMMKMRMRLIQKMEISLRLKSGRKIHLMTDLLNAKDQERITKSIKLILIIRLIAVTKKI